MDATREPSVRSFWYSVTLVIVFNSIFLTWVLFKPGTQHFFVLGDDIGQCSDGFWQRFSALSA